MNKLINCSYEFIKYQIVKGNSKNTVEYYKYALTPFMDYFGNDFNIEDFNKSNLRDYSVILRSRDLSSQSIKSYSKGIKAFLSWLYTDGYTQYNLSLWFPLPKAKKMIIDILTDEESKQLFNSFDLSSIFGLRNYLMCALMFDSGLRKSEVVNLRIIDVHYKECYIIVNGKGDKQRIVPISHKLSLLLSGYCHSYLLSSNYIFISRYGTPITTSTIDRLFKTLKTKLSIPRLHAHLLRHTFATRFLFNGGDLLTLQLILGHTGIDTCIIYLHLSQSMVNFSFSRFSPMDNLCKGGYIL